VLVLDDRAPITEAVLAETVDRSGDDLALIARAGTGVDAVDVGAAAERGIPVTNVPHYGTESVATHAVGLLLAAWRSIPERDRAVRGGEWDWRVGRPVPRLADGTLGIVGFGAIGKQTAASLAGFDLDVVAYDPYVSETEIREHGARRAESLADVLEGSDALSIHAPLTDETEGMIGGPELAALPDHAVLVNTARGGIVDEAALEDALDARELRAAGLDVLESEPPGEDSLLEREDVVTTPHAAWYSEASRRELNETVGQQVQAVLADEDPEHRVDPGAAWL